MTEYQPKRKPGRPKSSGNVQTMPQILHTASRLFMDQGFEKVSLETVAQACGVTKASIYYYFNNKSELFTEALLFVLQIAYMQTERLILSDQPLRERLIAIAEGHMRNAHVDFETMMREASAGLTDEQIHKIRDGEAAIHHLLGEAFHDAILSGQIAPCDPVLLAHVFTGALTIRNRQPVMEQRATTREAAAEVVDLLWLGMLPRP
ncbi:TetR/AcrR family transcriptional regulator [Paenibacillus sp. GCM10012307]|uniref:TetR/AcrR family transcriptional regulator n=1 Tax=Paenibacillus roseus TaxID=2798579 RepID=A0A934J9F9_9BACL|nr:TetR/AcrR family transcriptional regulator [Paenibacillus roseus]MBJ6362728.1 TetR/AcrR family transcriptional regulator [Paenibacillus roseus]